MKSTTYPKQKKHQDPDTSLLVHDVGVQSELDFF